MRRMLGLELLERWAEMAAFTPVMRTHEGNRPGENLQVDQDPAVLAHFARMTRIYRHLAPYLRALVAEAAAAAACRSSGRCSCISRPTRITYAIQDQYLYGPDLLVAPVHASGVRDMADLSAAGAEWVHVWTGDRPCGRRRGLGTGPGRPATGLLPPGSPFAGLFQELTRL